MNNSDIELFRLISDVYRHLLELFLLTFQENMRDISTDIPFNPNFLLSSKMLWR